MLGDAVVGECDTTDGRTLGSSVGSKDGGNAVVGADVGADVEGGAAVGAEVIGNAVVGSAVVGAEETKVGYIVGSPAGAHEEPYTLCKLEASSHGES